MRVQSCIFVGKFGSALWIEQLIERGSRQIKGRADLSRVQVGVVQLFIDPALDRLFDGFRRAGCFQQGGCLAEVNAREARQSLGQLLGAAEAFSLPARPDGLEIVAENGSTWAACAQHATAGPLPSRSSYQVSGQHRIDLSMDSPGTLGDHMVVEQEQIACLGMAIVAKSTPVD